MLASTSTRMAYLAVSKRELSHKYHTAPTYRRFCPKSESLIKFVITMSSNLSTLLSARRYASAVLVYCVSLSLCLSQTGVVSKRMNGSSSFWRNGFLRPVLSCILFKFEYLRKYRHFPLELCRRPKLWTIKNFATARRSSQHVVSAVRQK